MPTSVSTRTSSSLNPTRQQLDELDALLKRMLELPVNQPEEPDRAEAESEEVADEPPPVFPPPVTKPAAPTPLALSSPSEEEEDSVRGVVPSISYMVVETASPRPLPPASGFEPRPSPLMPPEDIAEEEAEPPLPVAPEPMAEERTEPEEWVPLRSTWQPSPQTWPPLADSWHQANGAAMPRAPHEMAPREIVLDPPTRPHIPLPVESAPRPAPTAEQMVRPSQEMTGETPVPPTSTGPRLSLTAEDAPAPPPPALLPLLWFNQGFDACTVPLGAIGRWLSGSRGRQTLGLVGLACLAAAAVLALSTGMAWTR